jgi:Flp pilus assembly pilin Flp
MSPEGVTVNDGTNPHPPSRRFAGDDGAGLVEYALLLALIVVVCLSAVTFLGTSLDGRISRAASQVEAAPGD